MKINEKNYHKFFGTCYENLGKEKNTRRKFGKLSLQEEQEFSKINNDY